MKKILISIVFATSIALFGATPALAQYPTTTEQVIVLPPAAPTSAPAAPTSAPAAPTSAPGPIPLPPTGSSVDSSLLLAMTVLILGAGIILVVRQRRQVESDS